MAHAATLFAPADVQRAAAYSQAHRGDAVLVWQDGREVFAQAQNGFDLNDPHVLASGSKTFGCLLAVALQDAGVLRLDERAADTLTEWRGDARRDITVRQLLNFTGACRATWAAPFHPEPRPERRRAGRHPDLARRAGVPLRKRAPGGVRGTRAPQDRAGARGGVAGARAGRPGRPPVWARDRAGHADLAGGARLSAREWARVGQLLLQGGQWQGRTLLSAAGLGECHQGSAALSVYGLNLWLNVPTNGTLDSGDTVPVAALNLKGDRLMPSQPTSVFMAAGAANQRLYVLPDRNAVIVRFGRGGDWNDDTFLKLMTGP